MNVPKWLIPVLSIVAALAVGVAAALIGIQFAPTVVAEHPAAPEIAPVIAPIATGLTDEQAQQLIQSSATPTSPIVGSEFVMPPSDLPLSETDEAIFHELVVGGPEAPADSGADGTGATDSATSPLTLFADDPCSTTDGSIPDGCPDGLHSAIFALTSEPEWTVEVRPYGAPCGTEPVPNETHAGRVDVPALVTPTTPRTLQFWVSEQVPGVTYNNNGVLVGNRQPDPAKIEAWEAARAADTPADSLPDLSYCVILPNLAPGAVYKVFAGAIYAPTPRESVYFNTGGAASPQGLHISTVGGNGLLAYVNHPATEQVAIRAYAGDGADAAHCDDVRGLTDLSNVSGEDVALSPQDVARDSDPAGYDHRYALGFLVPAGSTVLVCAKWYNDPGSPSWERIVPLRTDSALIESPDAILPVVRAQAINGYSYPGADSVVVSAETAEGAGCGLRSVTLYDGPAYEPDGTRELLCALGGAGAVTAFGPDGQWFLRTSYVDLDIAIRTTVNRSDGSQLRQTNVLPTQRTQPPASAFSWCVTECGNEHYFIEIPGYPHSEPGDGDFVVTVSWMRTGHSGLSAWRISSDDFATPEQPGDPSVSAPLLDTVERISPVLDGASDGVAADMTLRASTPADYVVRLTGLGGESPCALGGASLTTSGHVDTETDIHIPGLCYGEQYWASISLTNSHGTTVWGYENPTAGWLSNLISTPRLAVDVQYTASLDVPYGRAATVFGLHIDRQDLDPAHLLNNGCVITPITNRGTTAMLLGSTAQLHIQYQVRPRGPGSGCSVRAGDATPVSDVYLTLPLADILASPDGYRVTSGPVDLVLVITPTT